MAIKRPAGLPTLTELRKRYSHASAIIRKSYQNDNKHLPKHLRNSREQINYLIEERLKPVKIAIGLYENAYNPQYKYTAKQRRQVLEMALASYKKQRW